MATSLSLGELAARISSDRTAVFGSSRAVAASTTSLCAAGVGRIAIEDLLGNLQRLGRVFAARPCGLWRPCGEEPALLQHLLEETAAAAGLSHLRRPQRLAAFIQAGLLRQDLVEEIDGVIEVVPLQRVIAFGEEHPQVARKFIQTLFCHGRVLSELPTKIQPIISLA